MRRACASIPRYARPSRSFRQRPYGSSPPAHAVVCQCSCPTTAPRLNPQLLVDVTGEPDLREVTDEVRRSCKPPSIRCARPSPPRRREPRGMCRKMLRPRMLPAAQTATVTSTAKSSLMAWVVGQSALRTARARSSTKLWVTNCPFNFWNRLAPPGGDRRWLSQAEAGVGKGSR